MKDFRNSRSNLYVSKDDKDVERPFTVVECASRRVITRCETRDIAEGIAKFNLKKMKVEKEYPIAKFYEELKD